MLRTKENTVIYQIYPKSFQDSNGDGIGDLRGIINRLDYIQSLGVDMIWITPFFTSPMNDNGYDVADYRAINPLFGTMDDFDELVDQAKKRNLDIMLDMVFNHTSTEHKWFKKALTGDPEYMDYYIFKDKPTNWISKFGGNAWEYVEHLDKYYLHLFDVTQADLNWDNPKVRQELYDVLNFWIAKGVKGFRMDVINLISKPEIYEDDLVGDGRRFYTDGPNIHQYLQEMNDHTFGRHDDILTVGEMSSTNIEDCSLYSGEKSNELSMVFSFHHLKVDYRDGQKWELADFEPKKLFDLWRLWQTELSEKGGWNALFLNNHDQPRSVSRFGNKEYHQESASLLATATFLMQGTPFIYQGEELGIPNTEYDNLDRYKDVEAINYIKEHQSNLGNDECLKVLNERSRDNGRTPMPWNLEDNYGFSSTKPWLDFSLAEELIPASEQMNRPSILTYYQALIALRKANRAFQTGTIRFIDSDHEHLFNYIREDNNEHYLVLNNFSNNNYTYPLTTEIKKVLFSNQEVEYNKDVIEIKPYQAIVLQLI
ncbi:alpha,alpha-phosphotrehalase [Erysipelothrix urinaevulpis]|uniref:alpha,alpha-phosphotrehalase n=1 Tax=Erysipelothrix urinaevulpis TaxID=2683717 RepID=UPI0013599C5D|nr:alpha,alpha-phosphotrehalase [Erysipelothrix urinaevulpis]